MWARQAADLEQTGMARVSSAPGPRWEQNFRHTQSFKPLRDMFTCINLELHVT
jgi:hypothetical protein